MKLDRFDLSYESRKQWGHLCPEDVWRNIEVGKLNGLLPSDLLAKSNSVFVMCSGSPQATAYVANLNRVDFSDQAIDQEPYIIIFDHVQSTASGGFVHHGNWDRRTIKPGAGFFDAVSASGIQAHYPLAEIPTSSSGYMKDLQVSSQKDAFWNAFSLLRESNKS